MKGNVRLSGCFAPLRLDEGSQQTFISTIEFPDFITENGLKMMPEVSGNEYPCQMED